ncbi:lymphocyte antigen 6E-like [Myiozetetes cayanensis]|uniref:lymphocyte antigen 6E-like n=1 Tax=Myiozetetes cayanensis TaxID=478635 RepID=UPI00215F9D93|nr:lymphocyte antigen 6E-like [Myiozetetes cayanensis]
MRAPLVTLLAAVLCVQQAYPFMCYICQEQESNKDCLTISMCSKEDRYCVTVRKDVSTKPNKPKYVISKMCSPTCPAASQHQNQSSQRVFCCEKPLCNVNGASSKQSSFGVMSLGVLASVTCIFACGL